MKYSSETAFVFLSVLLTASASTITCDSNGNGYYRESYYSYEKCTVRDLTFSTADAETLNFPVYANFEIKNCIVDYMSPEIMKRMQWISDLSINGGSIPKVYLKPDLLTLDVKESSTVEIVIDDNVSNHSLTSLTIVSNSLNSIPKNLNKLKALSTLNFKNNDIQYMNFSDFIGLDDLTEIDLSSNKLYAIVTNNIIRLKSLTKLDLSNNFIMELDFNNWKFPALDMLSVESNSLRFIKHFDETTFPLLSTFRHSKNAWDCRWSNTLSFHLRASWTSSPSQLTCSKSTQLSASFYRQLNLTTIHDKQFKLDSLEEVEDQLRSVVEDTTNHSADIGLLKQTISAQQSQIADLLKQIHEQQTFLESLSSKIKSLEERPSQLPTSSGNLPKDLAEKLIVDLAYVIRKNIGDDVSVFRSS
ncbi:uncharacterized protein LOC128737004 [Sabethes cyaneus]|uniref:uncharacterized protein LOC128737004 n=1 Tax=Sabethes cyaneus TaxID=53552 RepID=UPI00237DACB6|nr:uncharacterized protein LOC128737004 [Sabethes cyaneus]